ncbi:MAG: hypothetical protein AB7E85_00815 [Pseudobdellovibrionaceae bacterium]
MFGKPKRKLVEGVDFEYMRVGDMMVKEPIERKAIPSADHTESVETIVDRCLYGVSKPADFSLPVCTSRLRETVFHLDDAKSFLVAVQTSANQWTIREKFIYPETGEEIDDPLKTSFSKMTAVEAVTDTQMLHWLYEFEKFGELDEQISGDLDFRDWAKINGYAPDEFGEFHRINEGLPHHTRFSQAAIAGTALAVSEGQALARRQAEIDTVTFSSAPFQEGMIGWLKSQFVSNGRDIRKHYWKLYAESWYPIPFIERMECYATHPYKALLFNHTIMEKGLERLLCVEDEKLFARLEKLVLADEHYAKSVRLILPQLLAKTFSEHPWDNGFKTCRTLNDFKNLPELNAIVGDEVRLQAIEFLARNKPSDKKWMKAIAAGMSDPHAGRKRMREALAASGKPLPDGFVIRGTEM